MFSILIFERLRIPALSLVLFTGLLFTSEKAKADHFGVSFQVFYDALTPYGDWVKDARYGYIWLPAVYGDFHPYGTNGHWVMTEFGNTWVSDYDWGWAPFHYGRWYFDDYYQSWAWIPGYEWAPAWVSWRSGGGYYGWAPLGPGVSINVQINIPIRHWVFIPSARIYHRNVYGYYAPYAYPRTKVKIINRTTVINNTVVYNNYNVYAGPSRREVERITRQTVPVYQIRSSDNPGRSTLAKNEVRVYRPDIDSSRGRSVDARPSRMTDSNQARTSRSSRSVNSSANQPSQVDNSRSARSGRTASPSARPSEGRFEMKPVPSETRSREAVNTRTSQPSRTGSVRNQPAPSRESQVRTQSGRSSQVRTQPQPSSRESVQQRGTSPSRAPEVKPSRQPNQSQVRTAPSRSSDSRVAQPSRTQSKPEVRATPSARKAPEVSSRSKSSGSSRGNSREKNN